MAPSRKLEVQAAFHEQVHASKITALSFSPGGTALLTGCDAAAPKAAPDSAPEPPAAAVDPLSGNTLAQANGLPTCNVRLLLPLSAAVGGGVLCAAGDGALWTLSDDGSTVLSSAALPGTPAAAAEQAGDSRQAAASEAAADGSSAGGGLETSSTGNAHGPEFVPDTGYRGHREGYLFREGVKGRGYYRKDVVRRYCPSAAAQPPAAPATPPPQAAQGGSAGVEQKQMDGEAAWQYIQRLLAAPPSMHSVVADAAAGLLFTASLGPSDCSIRVWRLWKPCKGAGSSSSNGCTAGPAGDGSTQSGGGGAACQPQPVLLRTLTGHTAPVLSLALSHDRRLLFSGSHDATVRVWSTRDWHCLRVLKGHGSGVRALAAAPDGATLYTAAADNTIRAWSTQHWVCLRTMHGRHEDHTWPACLALSPDGALLASGSTGPFGASTIKVFQTSSDGGREAGECLASFAQLGYHQKGGISALLFSADGDMLYTGASDGALAAWHLRWREAAAGGGGGSAGGLRRGFL